MTEQKTIEIKMVGLPKRVPPELISGITKSIGSSWKEGTTTILTGLTDEEIEYLLPSLINVSPSSPNWEEAVKKYFSNLSIKVNATHGTKLNISTKKKKVFVGTPKEKEVDFPENVKDYISYKYCLVFKNVGKNKEQAVSEMLNFYIEDPNKAKAESAKINEIKDKIDIVYIKLTEKDEKGEFKRLESIDAVIRHFNGNPLRMDNTDKQLKLKELADKDKLQVDSDRNDENIKFYNTAKDPNLTHKGFILSCLTHQVLTNRGDYIVDAENSEIILGNSMDAAVAWLKDGANSSQYAMYKKLNEQRTQTINK